MISIRYRSGGLRVRQAASPLNAALWRLRRRGPEFWGEVQPPGVTEGARYSFSPSRLCPLETEQKAGVRNGKPDFSLRNQCCRRGCTSRRNPPMTHDWGRYFERMTAWKKVKGKDVTIINPLDDLIRFMRDQIESERTYRNAYEMTIYDPARDAGKVSNRQCLSFMSFKLTNNNALLLTVMYRNHAYVARGLGNFLGLWRLQAFVTAQSGAKLGSLTCISTHAVIDASKKTDNGVVQGWTATEANALIKKCRGFLQ